MEPEEVGRIAATASRLQENIERVIVGKGDVVTLVLVTILCEGHLLIQDVPGTGKTVLAKAVARSLGCTFRRVQGTPDLLPSDITGPYVFNQQTSSSQFRPGPLMAQIVLVDEINRAMPRTQAALLEAMQERQVTVEGETMALHRPFLLMATQNPIELEGTFPLPEAQLDRFLMQVSLGYPSQEEDRLLLHRFREEACVARFPREEKETFFEYLATLERHLPDDREALERITEDYVAVRYGEQPVSQQERSLLNRLWRNVYARIRELVGASEDSRQ